MDGNQLVVVVLGLASFLRHVSDLPLPLPNTVTVRKCPAMYLMCIGAHLGLMFIVAYLMCIVCAARGLIVNCEL